MVARLQKFYPRAHVTHLKYSKSSTVILQKVKKKPDGFCTYPFFASEIILIFGGIFLYRLYRLPKVKIKRLRVPKTDFARNKCITRKETQIQVNPVGRQEIFLPKATPKNTLCLLQNFKVQDMMGLTVIVDNFSNAQILSAEDMLTDKIELIISNGVETICGKI